MNAINMTNKSAILTDAHIEVLRKEYGKIAHVNPDGPAFTQLRAEVASWTQEVVTQVADLQPPIKWLSYLAKQELAKRAAAVSALAEQYSGCPVDLGNP